MPRKKVPKPKVYYVTSSDRAHPWRAKTLHEAILLFTERVFRSTTRNRNSLHHGTTIRLFWGPDMLIEHIGERKYRLAIIAAVDAIKARDNPQLLDNPLDL